MSRHAAGSRPHPPQPSRHGLPQPSRHGFPQPSRLRAGVALLLLAVPLGVATQGGTGRGAGAAGPGVPAQPATATAVLSCDLTGYRTAGSLRAAMDAEVLTLEWNGAGAERLRLRLAAPGGTPLVRELAIREGEGGAWTTALTDARFEYSIVEGFRRISNQQLVPLRALGVELTQEVVDRYKWDVFWDAPLDLRPETGTGRGGNPPPAEGVANQPGLPRSPDEVRRAAATYQSERCTVTTAGRRMRVAFPGLTLGSFTGELGLTVFEGTNLIEVEAVASTNLPSVAYKYDVGIAGLGSGGGTPARVSWRDVSNQMQAYGLRGPANRDPVVLKAANRLVVAETGGAAIAAFPPPHTFFWAREVEINVGNNWYRRDADGTFAIGIRQGEQEVVEQYLANWSLYSAPPGSVQRMKAYFYPTLGDRADAFDAALAFTSGDVYPELPGYKVVGSHYHTDVGRDLMATGSMDSRLTDFDVLRSAGIDIAGPVDRPRDATQLEEQHWLFEGAKRHSDDEFVVWPQMENSNLLGGHWDLLFSHPVYYVDERAPGTPLVTQHPEYGRMYNIGSAEDMMAMVEAENMLIYMPHPRTKGSTGYPDAIKDTPQFLSDRYRGVGWRWGMGSDLSEVRLSDFRVIPLLDDMNNWIARTQLRPKYLLAITETYAKAPGDDVYANGPVSYLRLSALPEPGNYRPIVDALMQGDYFVTSGEVLIPEHRVEGSGADARLVADVRWTFPLDFVEVVYGDGERVGRAVVDAKDLPAFGRQTFTIPFDARGQAWVRVAAWDTAGNGAMTNPVRVGGER